MSSASPALGPARALVRATRAPLVPVLDVLPGDCEGAILMLDELPSEARLAELAAVLPRVTAVVLWAPGWDGEAAVAALGRHGIEHGTVSMETGAVPGILCVLAGSEAGAAQIAAALAAPARPLRTLAILPAYNEADVIYHAVGALVSEGVDVYLIDHCSTDGTAAAATPWLGRGLVHIERFPEDAGYAERNREEMVWRDILRRVQEVSGEITADWYLFTNADEFREAPWPGVTLAEALREVDELGYNAVNFELFDFRPVDDSFRPGDDPRRHLRYYESGGHYDAMQIKAWKRQAAPVDLVEHGGHDLLFAGKRIFPVPFILRHYPIRSSDHGRRKVLGERLPRFAAEERADGWHVQYDRYADGAEYLHDPATLIRWDASRARAELLTRATRGLLLSLCVSGADPAADEVPVESLGGWMARRGSIAVSAAPDLQVAQERLSAAVRGGELPMAPALDAMASDVSLAYEAHARVRGDIRLAGSLGDARRALPRAA